MDEFLANLPTYAAAATGIVAGLWGIFKIIAKLTPTTKDDEFAEKFDPVVSSITKPEDEGDDPPAAS